MRWLVLTLLLWPLSALAAETQDVAQGVGGVVAAGAAAEAARRLRKRSHIDRGHRADVARFGWSPERAAREAVHAKRAAKRRKRKAG